MKKYLLTAVLSFLIGGVYAQVLSEKEIAEAWYSGMTLPVGTGVEYAPAKVSPARDKGMNVLVDVSHECNFGYIWTLPRYLQELGYRGIASQASVNTVLDPKGVSRIRVDFDSENKIYPFAWHPNFRYNVIITFQRQQDSPAYTDAECKAFTDFVKKGGSLVILAPPHGSNLRDDWSMNKLAGMFDAGFNDKVLGKNGNKYSGLTLSSKWEVTGRSGSGEPVQARRAFGKGRVVISGSPDDMVIQKISRTSTPEQIKNINEANEIKNKFIEGTLAWLCEKQKPYDEKYCPVRSMGGGGGAIYPELEKQLDGFIVYYTPNVSSKLLHTVDNELNKVTEQILEWLPSEKTVEPMHLIISAGNGGGWAVNAYRPKENGIINLEPNNFISIYAHELAHTLGGPVNHKGEKAAYSPFNNQGEEHAGWFQGKINAVYEPALREQSVKRCQEFFATDMYKALDIKKYAADQEYATTFGKGKNWHKIWVIWQKLDDIYGTAWYPRWKYVQYTRWADDPKRVLTWEESIEDMSIAVGEDLFPFFMALNTSLARETMGEVDYGGRKITLQPAGIDPFAPPGKVKLEPAGDWKAGL